METSTETAMRQRHSSQEIWAEISGQCFATSIKYSGKTGKTSQRRSGPIKANRDLASSLESSSRFSQMAWITTPAAMAVAASYDFDRHHSILDVAGGTGSFLVHVLRRNSSLKGTLFELPGACAVARQKLAELPEGVRINIVEGDVFKDPFPGDYDVVIVANTIHIFSVAHNIELLRKIRAHVRPGARLLLADFWTDPSHSQPAAAALISGSFLLTSGEGQAYSEEEADGWLGQTGWQKLERKPLAGPLSLIVAEAI
jgi:SAM-dependent methyltransferase